MKNYYSLNIEKLLLKHSSIHMYVLLINNQLMNKI